MRGKFDVDASPRNLTGDVDAGAGESPIEPREIRGLLRRPWLRQRFARARRNTGFLIQRMLDSTFFDPEPLLDFFLDDVRGYGVFTFDIYALDPEGNESAAAESQSIFLAPEPLGVQTISIDVTADVLTLSFEHQTLGV